MGDLVYLAIINDPTMSNEQRLLEKKYKKYVDEHVSNVNKVWKLMKSVDKVMEYINTIFDDSKFIIATVDSLIIAHDMSKYGIEEWEAYRKHFYPIDEKEKEDNIANFEKAWEHHYMNNLHHWNYWYKTKSEDKMPIEFVIEMCCDWIAMSLNSGGTAYNWYLNQKDIVLGNKQSEWVTNILKKFYGKLK